MPPQANAHVSPAMLRKRMLQHEIIELRRQRLSWRKIGEEVGLSHEYARRLWTEAVQEAAQRERGLLATGERGPGGGGVAASGGARPQGLSRHEVAQQALRLRRQGCSYREIAIRMRRGKDQIQRLVESEYTELAEATLKSAAVALGEALDQMDGLIMAASVVLHSEDATTADRLRAIREIGLAREAKMRWLGADGPKPFVEFPMGREALAASEVAGLTGEQLDKEMEALGWHKTLAVDQEPDTG